MSANVALLTAKDWRTAQLGSRFVANNPTPGTGLATHAAPTSYDQTKPIFYVYNGGTKTIYPQRLRFLVTVVSTGGTGSKYTFALDRTNLYASGGTALTIQPTTAGGAGTGAVVYAGAVVASAAVNSQLLANCTPRGATVELVWDEYQFVWGATDGSVTCAANTGAAAQISSSFGLAPVAIPPGYHLKVVQWKASQSVGPTVEVYFDWIEL